MPGACPVQPPTQSRICISWALSACKNAASQDGLYEHRQSKKKKKNLLFNFQYLSLCPLLSLGTREKSPSPFCSLHPLHTHPSHERHIHTDKSLPSSSLWDCMAAGHQIRAVTSTGSVSTGLCWSTRVSTRGRRGEGSPGATLCYCIYHGRMALPVLPLLPH